MWRHHRDGQCGSAGISQSTQILAAAERRPVGGGVQIQIDERAEQSEVIRLRSRKLHPAFATRRESCIELGVQTGKSAAVLPHGQVLREAEAVATLVVNRPDQQPDPIREARQTSAETIDDDQSAVAILRAGNEYIEALKGLSHIMAAKDQETLEKFL